MTSARLDSISTDRAPAAIGPYSQAVRSGDLLFCSGQIGLAPGRSTLVPGGVSAEVRQVLANLTAVLAAGGATWTDVVKTTIYLVSLEDFEMVNEAYGEVVGSPPPARATVGVAALPKGARVEIEVVARLVEA